MGCNVLLKLFACFVTAICDLVHDTEAIFHIRLPLKEETIRDAVNSCEKTDFLHMRKQRRRSASR